MYASFPDLPDKARVWLFPLNRDLKDGDQAALLDALEPFLSSWTSHNRPVPAAADILAGRVLLVAAHIDAESLNAGVSGCGIDKMEAAVDQAFSNLNVERAGPLSVFYRSGNEWRETSRAKFKTLVGLRTISQETPVLDLTPQTLGDVRKTGIEKPVHASWHSTTFQLVEA